MKTKAEIIYDIETKYNRIMLGMYPKDKLVVNIAYAVYQLGKDLDIDEITILKATINEYHKALSDIMTEERNKLLIETMPIRILAIKEES